MSENDISSDKTILKVKLSGEEYHDIVIDWKDTSRPYKQQVFRQLAEISGIPIHYNSNLRLPSTDYSLANSHWEGYCNREARLYRNFARSYEKKLSKEKIMQIMDGNEHFGLDIFVECGQDKHFYIRYSIVPERFISETECTRNFCQYANTRTFLNKCKDIITDDALHSQMKDLLVESRFIDQDNILLEFRDGWFRTFRQLNIMQYCRKYCYIREQQLRDTSDRLGLDYAPPQLYLRTRG